MYARSKARSLPPVLLNNAGIAVMHHELHDGHETTTTVHVLSKLLLTLLLREAARWGRAL